MCIRDSISKLEYFREDGSADLKVFEKALREVGFSKKDATKAASVFGKAMGKRDAKPDNAEPNSDKREATSGAADQLLAALEQRELLKALESRLK